MDLNTAYGTLALIVVLFLICRHQDRKPAAGGKPRMLPYRIIMMVLLVLFLAVAAHVVSLLTGQVVKPRNKFGM